MEGIKFIQATEPDIPALIELRIEFLTEVTGPLSKTEKASLSTCMAEYFKAELNRTYLSWYAVADKKIVSIAGMSIRRQPGNKKHPSGIWGYVMSVYTVPAYRKKGISQEVLTRLIDHAKSLGVTAFELHATEDGKSVYLKNGFELHPQPTFRRYL